MTNHLLIHGEMTCNFHFIVLPYFGISRRNFVHLASDEIKPITPIPLQKGFAKSYFISVNWRPL